ncbi:MAG: hypothetical protein LBE13_21180, partial [Bacteroidales bacterium]|nr:hypothetical protein [Bacteroidales bacterium]
MRKLIKYSLYGLLSLVLLLTGFLIIPYLLSPVYDFPQPKSFSGKAYYNPYLHTDSSWKICNFHAHSRSWGGLTDGKHTNID